MAEPSFCTESFDRGTKKCERCIKGTDNDCCRAEKACGSRVEAQLCSSRAHAIEHGRGIPKRIGVRLYRQHSGFSGSRIAKLRRGVFQRLPGRRWRIGQPGARPEKPEQVEL